MTFHVRLTVQDIHSKPTRSIIAIGETILIKPDGGLPLILTSSIQRKYSEISYSLSQSDEEGADKKMNDEESKSVSSEDSANMVRNVDKGRIQ
jgi:hypothetical protein